MSTTEQIRLIGKDAMKQLIEEADCFEQLAKDYTDSGSDTEKHGELVVFAEHFKKVSSLIESKIEQPSPDKLLNSVRVAAALLKKAQHPRFKMRVGLLEKEINYLEENANRWLPLKEDFESMTDECREMIIASQKLSESDLSTFNSEKDADENIQRKILLEKEKYDKKLLQEADELYKKVVLLKTRQLAELRVDRAATLRQKLFTLDNLTVSLQEKIETVPALTENYQQISTVCRQIESKLWKKIKDGSIQELEEAIVIADRLIEQVKHGHTKENVRDRATIIPKTRNIISINDELMDEQKNEIMNPQSPFYDATEIRSRQMTFTRNAMNDPVLLERNKKSPIVISAYFISIIGLVLFILLNIKSFM